MEDQVEEENLRLPTAVKVVEDNTLLHVIAVGADDARKS